MGRKLVIPGLSLTDLTAPKILDTDTLESAGSLLLIDPTHPAGSWPAGVPANAGTVRNLLWKKAQALIAGSTESSLAATVFNSGLTASTGLVERTGKGGLHGLISQASAPVSGAGVALNLPDAIKSYILANPTHKYFVSVWRQVTRAGVFTSGTAETFSGIHSVTAATSNYLTVFDVTNVRPSTTYGNFLGGRTLNRNTAGASIINVGAGAFNGTVPTVPGNLSAGASRWGRPTGGLSSAANHSSFVFYRFYLEDLTVSGRSYTELDALDYALFQKEVLTEGGRYYGDTFTSPTALP